MNVDGFATKFALHNGRKIWAESGGNFTATNQDFDFVGARIVKIYASTAEMNDYVRHPVSDRASDTETAKDLDATTESFEMTRDRVRSHSRLINWMRTKQISSSQRQRHLP